MWHRDMENVLICCNVKCPDRFSCAKFARAMDVNSGKILSGYQIVECNNHSEYEK